MRTRVLIVLAAIAAITLIPLSSRSQEAPDLPSTSDPLAPFERLIGGKWHLEGSYQEFEWGVGRRSVKARSFFLVDGEPKLVSEGLWFWHPGEKRIRGLFTAINMPVALFDYTTRFEENRMVNDLRAFGSEGSETAYVETWDFTDDSRFVWRLLQETPDGLTEVMGGTYTREPH